MLLLGIDVTYWVVGISCLVLGSQIGLKILDLFFNTQQLTEEEWEEEQKRRV
jgi:hypothetical protein